LTEKESSHRTQNLLFILFLPNRKPVLSKAAGSAIENLKLFNEAWEGVFQQPV
jgi:hypothetical protein